MGLKKTPQRTQEFNVTLLKIQPGHIAAFESEIYAGSSLAIRPRLEQHHCLCLKIFKHG